MVKIHRLLLNSNYSLGMFLFPEVIYFTNTYCMACFRTPLMLAAERGNSAVCDYLVGKGATLLLIDKNGRLVYLSFLIVPT